MHLRSLALAFVLTLLGVFDPAARARATSRDFIDETLLSQEFKAREMGLEFEADARLDRDYRLQGWYSWEAEFAPTRRFFLEGVLATLERGQGLELAGWRLGTRYRILAPPRWPVDLSATVEYEVDTAAAKHPFYERELVPRVSLTRVFANRFSVTANAGAAVLLAPNHRTRFAWGAGARYPEGGPLMVGAEVVREPLENATRVTPQFWIALPREMRLRLGTVFGTQPRPYRFVARMILETEF